MNDLVHSEFAPKMPETDEFFFGWIILETEYENMSLKIVVGRPLLSDSVEVYADASRRPVSTLCD